MGGERRHEWSTSRAYLFSPPLICELYKTGKCALHGDAEVLIHSMLCRLCHSSISL